MSRFDACVCKQLPIRTMAGENEMNNKKILKNKTHQPEQSELNMRTIYIFKMFENRKNAPEQERARTQCGSERTRLVQMTNWLNV